MGRIEMSCGHVVALSSTLRANLRYRGKARCPRCGRLGLPADVIRAAAARAAAQVEYIRGGFTQVVYGSMSGGACSVAPLFAVHEHQIRSGMQGVR